MKAEPVRYGITEDTGGHITYILGEMTALAERDDVTLAEIITRRFDDPALGSVHAESEEWIGRKMVIRRIDSGDLRYLSKEALFADRKAFTRRLIEELRARETLPDVIHAHFADAADVAAVVERELGIPFIYTAHSLGMDKRRAVAEPGPGLEARIEEEDRAISSAAAIVGSSRDECERQLLAYPSAQVGRVHRIVPGIAQPGGSGDCTGARRLLAPFLREPDRPIVLAIARPVEKKNLKRLVNAFGRSEYLRNNCNLVILAGLRDDLRSGEQEQSRVLAELVDAVDHHDLYGCVAYPKHHSRDQVDQLYRLAALSGGIFVNPALIEPYGLTLVEAAAHGLPVVATKMGGPQDIVGELGHGLLVDPRSERDIAQAMEQLLRDGALWLRCSRNGRAGSRNMSWQAYAAAFRQVAEEVASPEKSVRDGRLTHLVVSDLDNTLTGCDRGASRFSGFFDRRTEFGFVIATGRSFIEARRLVRDWKLPVPRAWITSVGSEIYLETPEGPKLDRSYADFIAEEWKPERIELALCSIAGLSPQADYEQRAFKRSYFAETPDVEFAVRDRLRQAGIAARVVFSHGNLLDVLPVNAGKAAAMRHVARYFDVPLAQVFAAGDSGNDADMLAACDNAILVGNHAAEVAELAGRANVYRARRHHGAGALEGVLTHYRARRAANRIQSGGMS